MVYHSVGMDLGGGGGHWEKALALADSADTTAFSAGKIVGMSRKNINGTPFFIIRAKAADTVVTRRERRQGIFNVRYFILRFGLG